jgi:hypothetical protein
MSVMCVCLRMVVFDTCCVFLRHVCPVLPVSLYCPFFVAPSVFSNVYLVTLLSCSHHYTTFHNMI